VATPIQGYRRDEQGRRTDFYTQAGNAFLGVAVKGWER